MTHFYKEKIMALSLEKGKSISLQKNNNQYGNISINLKWNQGETQSKGIFGFFGGSKVKNIDLDLGCLYEMQDGTKHVVQALGNLFGSLDNAPYIQLDKDDRTGSNKEGEFLIINGKQWDKVKRVLVFAYIYDGVTTWNQVDGVVHLKSDVSEFDIVMDNPVNGKGMCAIALIENVGGEMRITKLNDYYAGHQEMDIAHNWNMAWQQARK